MVLGDFVKLTKRLEAIARLVEPGAIVVDIGSDHGYLPIYLLVNKVIKYAYACDVREGPLASARKHAQKYQVDLHCILSDGLINLKKVTFDTIVIAGMGGTLLTSLLSADLPLIKNKKLILQPQNNSKKLRTFLVENNIKITKEVLVKENGIIYTIIVCEGTECQDYAEKELFYGRRDIVNDRRLLSEVLARDLIKNKRLLNSVPSANERRIFFNKRIELIEGYLNEIK